MAKKKRTWTKEQRERYAATLAARRAGKSTVKTAAKNPGRVALPPGSTIAAPMRGPRPKSIVVYENGQFVPYVLKAIPTYVRK
jgi:hypothetical protein